MMINLYFILIKYNSLLSSLAHVTRLLRSWLEANMDKSMTRIYKKWRNLIFYKLQWNYRCFRVEHRKYFSVLQIIIEYIQQLKCSCCLTKMLWELISKIPFKYYTSCLSEFRKQTVLPLFTIEKISSSLAILQRLFWKRNYYVEFIYHASQCGIYKRQHLRDLRYNL